MPNTDQLFSQWKGQSIPSFDDDPANDGQCAQWALLVRTQRDGLSIRYGNAIDWWTNRGSDTEHYDYIPYAPGVYPKKDDYAVWGAGVGSSAGHIDSVAADGNSIGFVGYDSNWNDIPTLRIIQHDYSYGILGYIRRKGTNMAQVDDLTKLAEDRLASINTLVQEKAVLYQLAEDRQNSINVLQAEKEDLTAQLMAKNPQIINGTVLAPGSYLVK